MYSDLLQDHIVFPGMLHKENHLVDVLLKWKVASLWLIKMLKDEVIEGTHLVINSNSDTSLL